MHLRRPLGVAFAALLTTALAMTAPVAASAAAAPAKVSGVCGSLAGRTPAITHVIVVQLQNHSRSEIVNGTADPYTKSLIAGCGEATNFLSSAGSGGPNRMLMTAGNTLGIVGSTPPDKWQTGANNIFHQLGAGRWRVLAENMVGTCGLHSTGWYWNWHNPAPYFTDVAGQCAQQSVPLTTTPNLAAAYTFVIPSAPNSGHDTSVTTTLTSQLQRTDAWLKKYIPILTSSAAYKAGQTAIFITWDNVNAGGKLPFIVLSPYTAAGTKVATTYNHAALLRASEDLLHLPLLGQAAGSAPMLAAFGLR